MYKLWYVRQDTSGIARTLSCAALLTACVLWAAPLRAACLGSPDPAIRQLQALVNEDARRALKQAQAALGVLGHAPRSDPARIAALYAVQAQGYSALELDADARAAASKGLELAPNPNDPVHLDLLSAYAENVYDKASIGSAVQAIDTARISQAPGSIADTCLLITLGRLQYRQARADLAIVSLTQAYRASMAAAQAEQRVLAAAALSPVMRSMGDYAQALTLNQEVIDWDTSRGASLDLSVSRFLRGAIYLEMHNYKSAMDEYALARKLSVLLSDEQGVAFADLRMCEAQIELRQLAPAEQHCVSALRVFTASQSVDVMKDAWALLARIDLANGRTTRALATLDDVLDRGGTDMPPRNIASLYKLRARTNAALRNYHAAYSDLDEYVQRSVEVNDAERARQATALRARFETDREIDRNASLKRELGLAKERSARQKEQLRWTVIAVGAGVLVIALLSYILIANMRHRRQLMRLAGEDGLTGLPNRRCTVDLATASLVTAMTDHEPMTVAVIDLDHFKIINDRCGHAAGDHVLKEFAKLGRESVRATDIFGRWGGEEFLLVMPRTTLDLALVSLERLRTLAHGIVLPASGAGLHVTLSAGLATNEADVTSLDEIVARADAALYKAKNEGRDLVRIAEESYGAASTGVRRAMR
jgi:diguanylate cyclase (GGDEF)-like protein